VIAYGITDVPFIITALEPDRVVLRCPDGLIRVALDAIISMEIASRPQGAIGGRSRQTQKHRSVLYHH
jgi:hypothetical protein